MVSGFMDDVWSIIAVNNKHTAKLHHVGSLYVIIPPKFQSKANLRSTGLFLYKVLVEINSISDSEKTRK
jgi:hypothetical protein